MVARAERHCQPAGKTRAQVEQLSSVVQRQVLFGCDAPVHPLNWGAVVPLYFLGHRVTPQTETGSCFPHSSSPLYHALRLWPCGRACDQGFSIENCCPHSADQGHAHDAKSPYGYDPGSAKYDAWMQEVIHNGNLDTLLHADPQLVEYGTPDSLRPSLILTGILKENPMPAKLLSHEVNVYFGICAQNF